MKIFESLIRTASRQALVVKKNSPHIFFGLGVVGTVASTVLACRSTLKLSDTLDEIQKDIDNAKTVVEDEGENQNFRFLPSPYEYQQQELVYVYIKAGAKITRLYAPSIIIGTLSIAALTSSHVQLARRNTALMAAYSVLQKAYDDYRDRVRDQVGEERELELYRGIKTEVITGKDGKKEEVKTVDPNALSAYAKIFDEASMHWERNPELNRLYIQCQQNYANNLLHARGHLFLNEVYDMLDIERTAAGAVVGWVIGTEGDNFVDFGLFEAYNSRFINGIEPSVWLDFNVDGVIYDKI